MGLRTPADENEDEHEELFALAVPRAVVLAQRVTGVAAPAGMWGSPLMSAQLEPWFIAPAAPGELLYVDRLSPSPHATDLVAAATAATPEVQRAVAVAEARRQAVALGVGDTPGLAEALGAAADGEAGPVPVESSLGRSVRSWLDVQRRASAASNAYRDRMTGAEQSYGFALGWYVVALRGVLDPDPRVAVLAALRSLTSGLAVLGDAVICVAVERALRGEVPPGTY